MLGTHLDITEVRDAGWVRLTLVGDLDVASVPLLWNRLEQLRAERASVRLDLSKLEFMDSSGLHAMIQASNDARRDGWEFEVERDVSTQVRRLFRLVHFESFLSGEASSGS